MKQYALMESKKGNLAFGVFLFAMLLLARDTLITSCLIGFTKSQVLMLGLICLLGVAFLIHNRSQWKQILLDRRMLAAAVSALILLLPMLLKRDWQMMYFSILLCLFTAIFLTYFTSYREVAKYYVGILTGLGIYSLIGLYILKPMATNGLIQPPLFSNSADAWFYNFGLTYVVPSPYWHRNFGIFREPGVYQFFVLLGLYLNHYAVSWKKQWQLWAVDCVLAAVMVSTFAVGGVIEMALFAVFLYFDKKWYREKAGRIAGLAAVAAVVCAVGYILIQLRNPTFGLTVFYEFYDMFLRLTTKSNSLVDRLSAIFTSAELFLRSPIVGDTISHVLHGTDHNTSSTLILYAILGFVGGSLNVAAWIALTWRRDRSILGNGILLVILFMSFNTQNLIADVFFWLFPYMALLERGLPLLKLPARKV